MLVAQKYAIQHTPQVGINCILAEELVMCTFKGLACQTSLFKHMFKNNSWEGLLPGMKLVDTILLLSIIPLSSH